MMTRRFSTLTLAISLSLLAPSAFAEPSAADRATARTLAQEGQVALESKNYAVAMDKFGRADSLVHAPTLLLGLARAQVGSSKLVEAQENYNRIIREGIAPNAPKSWSKAVDDANREVGSISPRIPWVTLSVLGPANPEVAIDSVTVPHASLGVKRAINPGSHKVKVTAEGFLPAEKTITLSEGQSLVVNMELEQAPDAPTPKVATAATETTSMASTGGGEWRKTAGYVALGIGGAALIVGGVSGGLALSKNKQLADQCPDPEKCDTSLSPSIDTYHRFATISNIGFIVGGIGAAAGVVLLLTSPKESSPSSAVTWSPYVGLGAAGVKGNF